MTRKRHILAIAGLLGLSCLVQAVVVRRATVTALDAVRFVGVAQQIDRQGLLPAIRPQREEPLFPAWVWVVHEGLYRARGEFPSIWAASAQLAAAIPLVLAVVPLYLALMRLVGAAAALAGSSFFCLLPEVSRLGADGISDSTHLLFFCVAFWAMVEYFRVQGSGGRVQDSGAEGDGRPAWLLLAGVATATAALARAEALVLAGALGVALIVFQFLPARRQAWRGLAAAAACFVLGLAMVLGPYLAVIGSASPRTAVDRVLGRHQVEKRSLQSAGPDEAAVRQMTGGEPTSFDVKQRSVSTRRRGYAAAVCLFGKKLAGAFGYWIGALALFGAWRLRRGPASRADRFVQVFFLLFSLAVIRFTAAEGYLAPRHLLTLVAAGIGSAGYGALELGSWIASRTGVRGEGRGTRSPLTPHPSPLAPHPSPLAPHPHPAAAGQTRPAVAWMLVVLAAVACLPQTLVRHHHSRLGHRGAGRWLAEQADAAGTVLDTRGWTGLYSGRKTYPYEQAPAALSDPYLAYVVVEKMELGYQNRRSRTLRWLINAAAGPTDTRGVAEFPHPAVRKPNQRPVLVYRWHPRHFARTAAGSTKNPVMKEDRHARANPSVRR